MSQVVKGVVVWVGEEKKFDNYSFKLKDNDKWFRSPNRAAGIIEKGHEVKLVVEENDRGDFDVKKKPELLGKGKPTGKGGGKFGGGGNRFKEDPEKASRITVQASQDRAIQLTRILLEQGAIKLPKTKPDAIETILLAKVDELTAKLYKQVYEPKSFIEPQEEIERDLADEDESDSADEEKATDEVSESDDELWDND
jgi:hypothetical protein